MSDLSWLNPTPHAIAVYASRPLSPAATQHSLPSGRYSLLGPDFHRLDRTSLRLAHLFDHLVGEDIKLRRDRQSERISGLAIDHEMESRGLLHWKIAWLRALENLVYKRCGPVEKIGKVLTVTHEAAGNRIFALRKHRRQTVTER